MPIHSAFLRYFDEVRRCGSIRQAARNLFVASSAVNRQILKLERELGVALLERLPGGVRLTPAGQLLAEHVERTLRDADRTLESLRALQGDPRERITIVGQESVIAHFLPPALYALHGEFPDIATAFQAAGGWQLNELLLAGDADVALAFDPAPAAGMVRLAACNLPVGAVVTPGHPLARRDSVRFADCAAFPILMPDDTWPLRRLLDRELAVRGLHPQVITSSNSVEFLRAMLDQELGLGFQTVVGIETAVQRGELVLVPLREEGPVMQRFAVCVRAGAVERATIQRLTALLTDRLAEYGELE